MSTFGVLDTIKDTFTASSLSLDDSHASGVLYNNIGTPIKCIKTLQIFALNNLY